MNKIEIPHTLKIAGYDYAIQMGPDTDVELAKACAIGSEDDFPHEICISTRRDEQTNSHTFIHELLHAANRHYNCEKADEETIQQISNGMHQIFEGLGIRFVRSK